MKILLAEADCALAERLFHLLVKNGYRTTAVRSGQAALDEIGKSYFDMVIAEACTPAVTAYYGLAWLLLIEVLHF